MNTEPGLARVFVCLLDFRPGPVIVAVITLGNQNKMRFSITTLLFLTLLIAAYFPLAKLFKPWQRARIASQHPMYALELDNAELRDGDTIETASRIFPTLKFVERNSDMYQSVETLLEARGMEFPEDADLYRHESYGVTAVLTFKNGGLVVHDFDDAVATGPVPPSLWFRSGILPIYSAIASLLLAAWGLYGKWHQSPLHNRKLTFDQLIYSVVALPAIFFASYVVSSIFGFFIFGIIARRFNLEKLDQLVGVSPLLGSGTLVMVVLAVLLIVPASILTKRFFAAGWPESKPANGD